MDETRDEMIPQHGLIHESRTDGDCFLVATHLGVGFEPLDGFDDLEDDDVKIVHGLPVGRGTLNGGRRFWHAWVEVTRHLTIPDIPEAADMRRAWGDVHELVLVVDRSQGQDIVMPRDAYYGMGQLNAGYVWRFTREEAEEQLRQRDHYGPWVDGWEEMEDV